MLPLQSNPQQQAPAAGKLLAATTDVKQREKTRPLLKTFFRTSFRVTNLSSPGSQINACGQPKQLSFLDP